MSEVGQKFKVAREKRGISIQEVGLSLKINPRVIAAIENGERESLPARTFLRGFVKSYAQFLRMDLKDVMDEFMKEYGFDPAPMTGARMPGAASNDPVVPPTQNATKDTASSTNSSAADTNVAAGAGTAINTSVLPTQRSLADSPGIAKENIANESGFPVGKIILGVILFAAVVFLAKTVDKYQRERVLPTDGAVTDKSTVGEGEARVDSSENAAALSGGTVGTPVAIGVLDPLTAVTATASGNSTTPPTSTPIALPTPTATPKAYPTPSPSPTASATTTPKPSPSLTPSPSPSPSPSPKPAASALARPIEVIIEATKPVRVRYDLGSGEWITLDLSEGAIQTLRSKGPVSLDIADGASVNLIVNGRDRGKSGPSGQSVQLRLRE